MQEFCIKDFRLLCRFDADMRKRASTSARRNFFKLWKLFTNITAIIYGRYILEVVKKGRRRKEKVFLKPSVPIMYCASKRPWAKPFQKNSDFSNFMNSQSGPFLLQL